LISPVTTSRTGAAPAPGGCPRPEPSGDAHDRVLDVARRGHHEVGQFVDDAQDVRVGPASCSLLRAVIARAARAEAVDVADLAGLYVPQRCPSSTSQAAAAFFGTVMMG
jgi:hypothetical protein